jgi:uracil-DNA glycosylase
VRCVDIDGPDEYGKYRDDPAVCLHLVAGEYGTVDGSAWIDSVLATVRIDAVGGCTRIGSVRGAAVVDSVGDSARIDCLCDSARIGYLSGSAYVAAVQDCARVGSVTGSAGIGTVDDCGCIGYLGGTATVGFAGGTAQVSVHGSGRVTAGGFATVHAFGGTTTAGPYVAVYRHDPAAVVHGGTVHRGTVHGGTVHGGTLVVPPGPAARTTAPTAPEVGTADAVRPAGALSRRMHPSWHAPLGPVIGRLDAMERFLRAEDAAGRRYLPSPDRVLRAFEQPFDEVRVVIVGQDPYPTPGHAVGLSFSVDASVSPLPGSLVNVFKEYSADLGLPAPSSGDLTPWTRQGVLLLNTVLTVEERKPASHRGKGWEAVTTQAIRALAARPAPLVAILWGRDARRLAGLLDGVPQVRSAHPSPMSAASGFFGSRPFSRANELLARSGAGTVDWRLP